MGDWDFYCFLCASTFHSFAPLDHDSDGELNEDDNIQNDASASRNTCNTDRIQLTPGNVAWLADYRVIGENLAATSLRRCYLSGRAEDTGYGHSDVAKGRDPVAPGVSRDDKVNTSMYRDFDADTETGAMPVHDCCLRILQRAFVAGTLARGEVFKADDECFGFTLGGADDVKAGEESEGEKMAEDETVTAGIVSARHVQQSLDVDALFQCLLPTRKEYKSCLTFDYGAMNDMSGEQYFYLGEGHEVRPTHS